MNEQNIQHIALLYLVVINTVTFLEFGLDKWKAVSNRGQRKTRLKRRIPEMSLLFLAVMGGSIGAWLGMKVWHHKTLHKKFKYGIPLILIVQIALLLLVSCKTKQEIEAFMPIQHGRFQEHSPSVFLVMYDREIGKEPLLKAIKEYKAEIKYDYNMTPCMAIKKPENKSLEETMQYFKTVKGVVSVEYDNIYRLTDPVKPRLMDQ